MDAAQDGAGVGGCEWQAKGEKSLVVFEILPRARVVREETSRYRKTNNGGMHAEDVGRLTPRPKKLLEERGDVRFEANEGSRRGETVLALIAGLLGILAMFWRDWIETLTGWDLDRGNGSVE